MADAAGDTHKDRPSTRACAYCNRSKTKCLWTAEPGAGSCQRCTRLKRPCSMPEPGEKRKRGPSTRVGQLEEKIDGIMSLLNASRELHLQTTPPSSNPSPFQGQATVSFGQEPDASSSTTPVSRMPANPFSVCLPSRDSFDIAPGLVVSVDEADQMLDRYRTDYSPKFPFVPIAPCLAACELYETKPFLFRVIIQAIAPQSFTTQREVARWIRKYLAEHVLVAQETRLELLQGLLLYIAWGDFNFFFDPKGNNLFQLAIGLAIEGGLNKPVKTPNQKKSHFIDEARRFKGLPARPAHTLDDMRAVLGVFYINSVVATLYQHFPLFPYTAYLRACRVAIENASEYESDRHLSGLVRMQQLVCRMHNVFPDLEAEDTEPANFSGASHMALAVIRAELETLKSELPTETRNCFMFNICYQGALVRIYEPAIYMRPSAAAESLGEGMWRSEALWFCLEAAKGFLETYRDIPVDQLSFLPCHAFSYFSYTVVTTTRLLFLNDSDWNQAAARSALDFYSITRRLGDSFDRANLASAAGKRKIKFVEDGRPVMGVSKERLWWISSWYLSRQGPSGEEQHRHPYRNQPPPQEADGGVVALDVDPVRDWSSVEFDSEWWEALLGDYNFGQAVEQES